MAKFETIIGKLKDRLTMKKYTILLLTILLVNSCQSGDNQQTVTIENKYSIVIPSYMTEASGLNDDASLQYKNSRKVLFLIVIDDSLAEMNKVLDDDNLNETYTSDINGYSELIMNGVEQKISVAHKSKIIDTTINNIPARLLTVSGRYDGIDLYYSFAFIQGKERYYLIMVWTTSNKEYEYKDKINRVMYSFKEL
jgi:hypothetical protein